MTDDQELAWWRSQFATRFSDGELPVPGSALTGRRFRLVEKSNAGDQAELDFEKWEHWFEVVLNGTAPALLDGLAARNCEVTGVQGAKWMIEAAATLADAAVTKIHARRSAVDAGTPAKGATDAR